MSNEKQHPVTAPTPVPGITQVQPQAIQPMAQGVLMPQKKDEQGNVVWNHGLCDGCCGGKWWYSCCCPCLQYGRNRTRLQSLRTTGQPHAEGGDPTGSDCMLFCAVNCLFGVGWLFDMMNRSDIRERYQITGSGLGDCCTAYWCLPCSLVQVDGQLRDEEQALTGTHAAAATGTKTA